jgi:hypothetical protein
VEIVALVPAYNEAGTIGETVKALLSVAGVTRVIVVDDASDDKTAEAAESAGAEVVKLDRNLGKGGAVNRVVKSVVLVDVLLLVDADTGETAKEAAKLLKPVISGEADMTVAVLPRKVGTGGFGLALGLARRIIKAKTGWQATAPLSGQRALNESAVAKSSPFAEGYGMETAMTVDVLRAGLRVAEVPAAFAHSYTYRDVKGFLHRGRQFLAIMKVGFRRRR